MIMPKPYDGKYKHAVAAFVDEFWRTHFRSPSFREIRAGCGIASLSTTRYIVERLNLDHDYFIVTDGSARGIVPGWVRDAITAARS